MKQAAIRSADSVVVLDFETTGMSPQQGDRSIEVGAVRLEAGQVTGRFQSLMNPGIRINAFIENFTGISNDMVCDAPCCEDVMQEFADFIDGHDLVALVKEKKGAIAAPKQVDFVESLPQTALGKTDKKALRKQYWGDTGRMVN